MIERYTQTLMRHRWLVLVVLLLVALLAAMGAKRLSMTTDFRVFFGSDNPQLAAFDKMQNTYTKNDNVLIVIAPKDQQVFTPTTLAAVEALTAQAWKLPHSIRVDSVTNFQHTHAEGDDLIVQNLVKDAATQTPKQLAAARKIALAEPLLVKRLIATAGDVTAINITIHVPDGELKTGNQQVVAAVRTLVNEARAQYPTLAFHTTGNVMMNNAFPEASRQDMKTLIPIVLGVVLLALLFLLRDPTGVVATLFIIVMSIAATLGLMGWLGLALTPPASSAPTIILTLAIADSVHILATFYYFMRQGLDKPAAMAKSLQSNARPIAITAITTSIGLLGLNFSDSPPFNQLGNIVAVGVTLAWIFSMTFLPAFMLALPVRARKTRAGGDLAMDRFAEFVVKHRTPLFWGNLAVIVLFAGLITKNEINDQFVEYFDPSTEFRADTDFLTNHLTGIYNVDFALDSGHDEGVSDPAFLNHAEAFANWLRTQPEVVHVSSFTDIMKRLNKNLHADDPAQYRLPASRELAAQYLLLYEMSLPFGLDLNNQLNVAKSSTKVSATLGNLTSNEMIAFEARARDWMKTHAPQVATVGASPALMFAYLGHRNLNSMMIGNAASLILVGLTIIIAFRSIRYGFISMIPNVVPIILAFGVWGLISGQVGLGLTVVGSLTLGIVVDDTIHFMSKFIAARGEGKSPEDAVRYVFATAGTSMWVLSAVLVAGFLVLSLSTFRVNADLGLLTAVTFTLALVADFLFLGPLLLKLEEKRRV
ncbi:MAG: MMPL family transporter [Thiobacillus sp.]